MCFGVECDGVFVSFMLMYIFFIKVFDFSIFGCIVDVGYLGVSLMMVIVYFGLGDIVF